MISLDFFCLAIFSLSLWSKNMFGIFLLLLLSQLPSTTAVYGLDVSTPTSVSSAQCLKNAGYSFAIPRAWKSFGEFDASAPGSVSSFWQANFTHVDVYLFPCSFGMPASTQVNQLKGNLTSHSVKYGMVWLDIEENQDPTCSWRRSKSDNCAFLGDLIQASEAAGFNTGIYTSVHEFGLFFEMNCTVGSHLPLWYPHYESPPQPNYDDFSVSPFTLSFRTCLPLMH